jgi:YD repeat-containing protein
MTDSTPSGMPRRCLRDAATILLFVAPIPADAARLGYHYDPLNRLVGVIYPDGSEIAYGYDDAGNRQTVITTALTPDTDGDGQGCDRSGR